MRHEINGRHWLGEPMRGRPRTVPYGSLPCRTTSLSIAKSVGRLLRGDPNGQVAIFRERLSARLLT
jgi:hypothetical protein